MALTNCYIDVPELVAWGDLTSADIGRLETAISAACRAIDKLAGRRFAKATTATARLYRPCDPYKVRVDDFWTTTDLAVKTDEGDDGTYERTWTSTDYELYPLDGIVAGQTGWAYETIVAVAGLVFPTGNRRAALQVTAQWGWAAVPDDIVLAALIGAEYLYKHKDAPLGIASFGEFGQMRVRGHPTIKELVGPYAIPLA